MNTISDEALTKFKKSRQLLQSIINNSEKIEDVFFSGPNRKFAMGSRCIELSGNQEQQLKLILGDELSVSYLYYSGSSGAATIEAKAYCAELIRFGREMLSGPFSFRLKLALLNYTRIMGLLFDRGDENYYVCEIILRDFLDEVEGFYLAQDAENKESIIEALFWGRADKLGEIKSYLDKVHERVTANTNEHLEYVRGENIDSHIKLI